MIWESHYWKQPLLEMADRLEALGSAKDLSDEEMVQLEKDMLIGFYSVRKLIETPTKATDATKAIKVQLSWFPNKKPVTWVNSHRIEELYDLKKRNSEKRDLLFVCGRIIHSYILIPEASEDGHLRGLFFTSDRDKNKRLYSVSLDKILYLFRAVGYDNPCDIHWTKDSEAGGRCAGID